MPKKNKLMVRIIAILCAVAMVATFVLSIVMSMQG